MSQAEKIPAADTPPTPLEQWAGESNAPPARVPAGREGDLRPVCPDSPLHPGWNPLACPACGGAMQLIAGWWACNVCEIDGPPAKRKARVKGKPKRRKATHGPAPAPASDPKQVGRPMGHDRPDEGELAQPSMEAARAALVVPEAAP